MSDDRRKIAGEADIVIGFKIQRVTLDDGSRINGLMASIASNPSLPESHLREIDDELITALRGLADHLTLVDKEAGR